MPESSTANTTPQHAVAHITRPSNHYINGWLKIQHHGEYMFECQTLKVSLVVWELHPGAPLAHEFNAASAIHIEISCLYQEFARPAKGAMRNEHIQPHMLPTSAM